MKQLVSDNFKFVILFVHENRAKEILRWIISKFENKIGKYFMNNTIENV